MFILLESPRTIFGPRRLDENLMDLNRVAFFRFSNYFPVHDTKTTEETVHPQFVLHINSYYLSDLSLSVTEQVPREITNFTFKKHHKYSIV